MLGMDPNLIMNHLSIAPGVKLVKYKLKKMNPHVELLDKAKLEKILKYGFIHAINYAKWILNIVLVSKHDKSIRVCIDFWDLNLACLKDDFLLPNIDMIVGYKMYSLMDIFFWL